MTKESMYDLLSKYLAGDISAEERRILFQQLKENEELRKEAAGIQNLSVLISMANEDGAASDDDSPEGMKSSVTKPISIRLFFIL